MAGAAQSTAENRSQVKLSHSLVLRHKLGLAQPRLDIAAQRFWSSPELARLFPAFLQELYAIVRGGLETMRFACDRAGELNDPVAIPLAHYLNRHIAEESDHEKWLLADMQHCGIAAADAQERLVTGPVAALLGAQMYWIRHEHPVAFLGYVAAIEGNPPTRAHLDEIRERTGLPDETFRCMREHADLDGGHAEELYSAIDGLPLTARQHQLLAFSGFETIHALTRIFDGLCAQAEKGWK